MSIPLRFPAVAALLALSACAGGSDRPAPPAPGWRELVTRDDRNRIRTWRDAWTAALAKARGSGSGAAIDAAGALLKPDSVLDDPTPPPGDYRCRAIKLGATAAGARDLVLAPPATCRIGGGATTLGFAQLDGDQRPSGTLYADGPMRTIFLGTMQMADESRALGYGRDRVRDTVGIVERIGPRRWRLVLPWPRWEATIEVIELEPAP